MISVVVVPVVRSPGIPVVRVEAPVPVRAPNHISGPVDKSYHRPGSDFIICGGYHRAICPVLCIAPVTGVGCLGVYGLHDIIPAVEIRIAYELYLYLSVTELLNGEDSHILVFVPVEGRA